MAQTARSAGIVIGKKGNGRLSKLSHPSPSSELEHNLPRSYLNFIIEDRKIKFFKKMGDSTDRVAQEPEKS